MRKAFNKEIVRSIRHSLSRFVAIFAIVALGAGFYAGLRMCAPDMRTTFDRYFDETAFMDVRLLSTLGFSAADAEAVKRVPGVSAVMPEQSADVTATIGDRRATVRVHGLNLAAAAASDTSSGRSALSANPDYLNRPLLAAGRWPQAPGECLLDANKIYANTAQLGDTVVLTAGVTNLADTFARTEFTVVGVVDSSYYVSFARGSTRLNDGNIDRVMFIAQADFADPGLYTDLFATVAGAANVSTFTSAYDDLVDPVTGALEALAPEREAARLAEVKATAQEALDEKRAEYDEAKTEADAQLADGQAKLDEAAAAIASAESRLAEGRAAFEAGLAQLSAQRRDFVAEANQAQAEIDQGWADVEAQQPQLDQLTAALATLQQQVAALEAAVTGLQTSYDAAAAAEALGQVVDPTTGALSSQLGEAQSQLAVAQQAYATQSAAQSGGTAALEEVRARLNAGQAQLDAGREQAQAEFAAAQRRLDAAERQLVTGSAELAEGRQALAEAEEEYATQVGDAEAKLAEALSAIGDAQAEIDAIEMPTWYVLGRGSNTGFADFSSDADRIEAISIVFPLIFFLVAALVALTTMTRMVDEERTLIGTYKALGYGKGRIAAKYLVYAGVASVLGSILGIVIGSQVLPRTIWRAYTTMYTAPAVLTPIDLPIALSAGAAAVGISLLATILAVGTTLRESPALLMLPRAPKPGRRILLERVKPIWSRLSFSQKVTARNLFRYKKRLLMTIIGIAGCTALLLTGFGLKDSIGDILLKQYGDIYLYNTTIGLDPERMAMEDPSDFALDDTGAFSDSLVVHTEGVRMENEAGRAQAATDAAAGTSSGNPIPGTISGGRSSGTSIDGYLCCPSSLARLPDFVTLRTREGRLPLVLDDSGTIVTEKAATTLHLQVGDTVYVDRLDVAGGATGGAPVALTVIGITEQYVAHFLYVSPALYRKVFGGEPSYNGVLGKATVADEAAKEELSQRLLDRDGVTTVQFNDDITSSFDNMLESLNSVVFVLILSAGLLAFIVLYNLTNLNVMERRREIATIKVLGFYESEVNAYIYRETAALTAIGCVLGLLLGVVLARYVITTVEIDVVMFGRTIHTMSFVYSAALTLLFAAVVNLAMRPRLRKIDMVESLKSVE